MSASVLSLQQPKDTSLLKIAAGVIALHLIFLFFMFRYNSHVISPVKSVQKLVVKTVNLSPRKSGVKSPPQVIEEPEPIAMAETKIEEPIEETHVVPKTKPKKPEAPKKVEAQPKKSVPKPKKIEKKEEPKKKPVSNSLPKPEPKKSAPKKEVKKPAAPKKIEKPKPVKSEPVKPKADQQAEAAQAKKRELLAKAQESISKIDNTRGKIASAKKNSSTPVALPAPIQGLHIDALPVDDAKPLNAMEVGYRDELASRLKLLLRLPEHGEVKIKLTLERSGKVCKVAIVNSQSSANSKYIEKTLPSLTFPNFGSNFGDHNQYTFLISLSNDL